MRNKFLWPFLSLHPSWAFIIGPEGGGSSFNKFDSTLCQDGLMSTNCSFGKILGKFNSNKEFCPSPDVQLFGWVEGVVVGIL